MDGIRNHYEVGSCNYCRDLNSDDGDRCNECLDSTDKKFFKVSPYLINFKYYKDPRKDSFKWGCFAGTKKDFEIANKLESLEYNFTATFLPTGEIIIHIIPDTEKTNINICWKHAFRDKVSELLLKWDKGITTNGNMVTNKVEHDENKTY